MPNTDWIPEDLRSIIKYKDNKYLIGCSVDGCTSTRQSAGKGSILKRYYSGNLSSLFYCSLHGGKSVQFTKKEINSWPKEHKRCRECLEIKPFTDFHRHSGCLFGYNTICIECRYPLSSTAYSRIPWERRLFDRAKTRSTKRNRIFSITIDDIKIPDICPILGKPIVLESHNLYAPSLDRIDSSIGYTPDNIQVVSRRANILKNNMTKEESNKLSEWFNRQEID